MIDGIKYIAIALVLIAVQFFILQEVNFGTWVKPMPYIYLVFILPFEMNKFAKLGIAYLIGFVLDALGNTYGMHAASTTLLCFSRIYADQWFLDTDAIQLQGFNFLTPRFKTFGYYARYILSLTFIHHFCFFLLNYFKFSATFTIIMVSILSAVASFLFILLFRVIGNNRA